MHGPIRLVLALGASGGGVSRAIHEFVQGSRQVRWSQDRAPGEGPTRDPTLHQTRNVIMSPEKLSRRMLSWETAARAPRQIQGNDPLAGRRKESQPRRWTGIQRSRAEKWVLSKLFSSCDQNDQNVWPFFFFYGHTHSLVPRPGIESVLQLWPTDLPHSCQNARFFSQLCSARDQTCASKSDLSHYSRIFNPLCQSGNTVANFFFTF